MFEEKKNANAYNYSQEFPPTLRDLVSRYTTTLNRARLQTEHHSSILKIIAHYSNGIIRLHTTTHYSLHTTHCTLLTAHFSLHT